MHVAVDAANLVRDRRGIGRYVRALLKRFLDRPDDIRVTLLVPDLFLGQARSRIGFALGRDDVVVQRRAAVPQLSADLVWYPWNGMTWTASIPSIATVHDVWPFVSPAADTGKRRREQTAYLVMAERARAIIANSRFTKGEIVRYLAVSQNRINVIHMGVDMPVAAPSNIRLKGAERYVLAVGEDEPRKDLATLRRAMRLLPDPHARSTGLVIAGRPRSSSEGGQVRFDPISGQLDLTFTQHGSTRELVTGEVSDHLLDALYAHAAVFAFPSTYEGFGLVILEAMARGIPVVASDAASIPEVAGDAALFFPAGDAQALSQALAHVITQPSAAAGLVKAGLSRAQEFSWDHTAQRTLEVFSDVLASAPS